MNKRYAASWESPKGPGDSRPTALQIIEDEELIWELHDKVIIITGCSSGIGIEAARALKVTGARLFVTARNLEKGRDALGDILEPGFVELLQLDLESLESVRSFVDEIKRKTKTVNILINNAGVRHTPLGKTKDGFETQFGTNHIAHFLLFQLLKPMLLAGSTREFHSRVVNVSSTAHRGALIDFDDLNMEKGYNPVKAYSQSKLANVYMANEIERRYGSKGLHGWSVHPGGIRTPLNAISWSNISDIFMVLKSNPLKVLNIMQSTEQGAATTVWAAVSKGLEGKGGKYLERTSISELVRDGYGTIDPGHALHAYNEEDAKRLWKVSNKLVGLEDEV